MYLFNWWSLLVKGLWLWLLALVTGDTHNLTHDRWNMICFFLVVVVFWPFLFIYVCFGIGATICIGREIQCVPCAGFFSSSFNYFWHVTCDTWHLTDDTWHMTCDRWWILCENFRSLALMVWDWRWLKDLEEKGDFISKWRRCL